MTLIDSLSKCQTIIRVGLASLCLFIVVGCSSVRAVETTKQPQVTMPTKQIDSCPKSSDKALTDILESIRKKYKIPAIAGAIVTSQGVVRIGVTGERKMGTGISVTLQDKWHLGSETKAMTAALIGSLVEQKKLRWDLSLADVFPKRTRSMSKTHRQITLLQLLSHHAGLPANVDWRKIAQKGSLQEQRLAVLQEVIDAKNLEKPGDKGNYSNVGYVVAAVMVERAMKTSWEQLMQRHIFEPLKMTSVGYGGVGTVGKIDQPWSHGSDGKPMKTNGPLMDNPLVMAPAGCVHCTMQDWALFISDQLRGAQGKASLLQPDTYTKLHTPPFGGEYALGWIATSRKWGGGKVLTHTGSNTMNYANVWLAPQRDFAVLVCLNQGGDVAFKASDEAVSALIVLYQQSLKWKP